MELAIVSDTHVPGRETDLPAWVCEQVEAADHVIHAGDFDAPETVARVEELSAGVTAVRGNIDPPTVDLPEVATVSFEGVTFVVVHGTGPHETWPERVARLVRAETTDENVVGVAGHTHTPTDVEVDGIRLLNPGSATGARPAAVTSMLTLRVEDGEVAVTLHEE